MPALLRQRTRVHSLSRKVALNAWQGQVCMSKTQMVIDVLLAIGVISILISSVAMLVMKDLYERLHYLFPPATLSVICFTAAVLIDKHFSQAGIKALLIMFLLLSTNAVD